MARSRCFIGLRVGVVLLLSVVIAACSVTASLTRPAAGDVTSVAPARTIIPSLVATRPPAGLMDVVWRFDGASHTLRLPTGLAADGRGHLYVVDSGNDCIQKLTGAGMPAARWGCYGSGPGQFLFRQPLSSPQLTDGQVIPGGGVAVDDQGNVYIADPLDARVQRFDSHGQFVSAWGSRGANAGEFNLPVAVAVDRRGQIYVADRDNHRIQVFDQHGAFRRMWGGQGQAAGEFSYPMAVAVDWRGHVYVADSLNHRIQKFDSVGRFLTAWGAAGDRPGEFGGSIFLAVDEPGRVYVADTYNGRVQVFDGEGILLGQWGSLGSGTGQFAYPTGIAVDERGDIYVADMVNGTIQMFRPRGPWPVALSGTPTPRPPTPMPVQTPPPWMTPTDR